MTDADCCADGLDIEHAELDRAGLAGGGWLTVDETVFGVWLVLMGETGVGVGTGDGFDMAGFCTEADGV